MKLTKTEIIWIKNLLEREAAEFRVVGEDEMTHDVTRSLALLMADNYQTLFKKLDGLKEAWEYKIIAAGKD